ncbi:MAG: hypothetical protein JW821_02195 [Deltaproteobacteria bacterium]|nr:hypothetical protein [Deltaproteobacteria bacterium]
MKIRLLKAFLNRLVAGFCITVLFGQPCPGAEQESFRDASVVTIGAAPVSEGNTARAREAAMADALSKGVEMHLFRTLGEKGMATNFLRLIQEVIPSGREAIENFNILAEEQIEGTYFILVRIKINEGLIEQRMRETGLVQAGEGPPIRILFLVSQARSEKGEPLFWWDGQSREQGLSLTEIALYRTFEDLGFVPVNRLSAAPEGVPSQEMIVEDLEEKNALRWGEMFSADAVLAGRCEITGHPRIEISLKAFDVRRGSLISQDAQWEELAKGAEGPGGVMEAVDRAVQRSAARLAPAIIRALGEAETGLSRFLVTVRGLRNFKQFREIKDFLEKGIERVQSVKQSRVSGDALSLLVEFSGQRAAFLQEVSGAGNLSFPTEVVVTEEDEIVIQVH